MFLYIYSFIFFSKSFYSILFGFKKFLNYFLYNQLFFCNFEINFVKNLSIESSWFFSLFTTSKICHRIASMCRYVFHLAPKLFAASVGNWFQHPMEHAIRPNRFEPIPDALKRTKSYRFSNRHSSILWRCLKQPLTCDMRINRRHHSRSMSPKLSSC